MNSAAYDLDYYPYFARRFASWGSMAYVNEGWEDASYCLDAPEMLPAGSFDAIEDLPTPTYIERTPCG